MKRGGEKNGTLEPEASAQQKNKWRKKGGRITHQIIRSKISNLSDTCHVDNILCAGLGQQSLDTTERTGPGRLTASLEANQTSGILIGSPVAISPDARGSSL